MVQQLVSQPGFHSDHLTLKQLIPAGGWRLLMAWIDDGALVTQLTHIVAWALATHAEGENSSEVVPVIPHPFEDHRFLTWDFSGWEIASVLVQPCEEPTTEQLEFVKAYAQDLKRESEAYTAACAKARNMRRQGASFEAIAESTHLSRQDARIIAECVDQQRSK
jgi:hypothetical protein